jgi:UDP-N-acetyl-D-mannosaminuronic acid dehydrogenase
MNPLKEFDIGIVGLGYVGLTLATALAEIGYSVIGVERRSDIVDLTNQGIPHFSETGLEEALRQQVGALRLQAHFCFPENSTCRVYVITVGTPLNDDGMARLDMIENASRQAAENMKDGALVILRSTVKVGTARDIVAPILASTGKKFHLAMCPERTLEGKALEELRKLPQIVGADDKLTRDMAAEVFGRLTNTIVNVSSLESAELIKLVDNTFRDVQFAFANEVARACEACGVNAYEVISSGKLGYPRTNVPLPGLVGGPCLEKDPHILYQSLIERGLKLDITPAARLVNERQPRETVEFIVQEMVNRGLPNHTKIAVLGLAFKGVPATDDLRGSMALKVVNQLIERMPTCKLYGYDPVISAQNLTQNVKQVIACNTLEEAISGAGVVIIANNHPDFSKLSISIFRKKLQNFGFVYDYWSHFSSYSELELRGFYFSVGNIRRIPTGNKYESYTETKT